MDAQSSLIKAWREQAGFGRWSKPYCRATKEEGTGPDVRQTALGVKGQGRGNQAMGADSRDRPIWQDQ